MKKKPSIVWKRKDDRGNDRVVEIYSHVLEGRKFDPKKRCDTFMKAIFAIAEEAIIHDAPVDVKAELQARFRQLLKPLGLGSKEIFEEIKRLQMRKRLQYCVGEAVVIRPYEKTPMKATEWRTKSGKKELKLWSKVELGRQSWYNQASIRVIRDEENKVLSWPEGTIGYVDLDYSTKSLAKTQNIRVKIDGYVGWTDYNNLEVYVHPKDETDADDDT